MSNKEGRRKERLQPVLRVRTEVLSQNHGIHCALFADILNLSETGVCLKSPLQPRPGDRLEIDLPRLDQNQPLRITGQVVWVKSGGLHSCTCGLEFIFPNPDQEARMRDILRAVIHDLYHQHPWKPSP